jgi:hypothetical protein
MTRSLWFGIITAIVAAAFLDTPSAARELSRVKLDGTRQDSHNAIKISGTLRDSSDAPVPGVTLELRLATCKCSECPKGQGCNCCPDQRQAITNSDGRFSFSVGAGTYRLTASLEGFTTVTQAVDVSAGQSKSITIRLK